MIRFLFPLFALATLALPLFAQEKLPPGAQVTRLEASPASVTLKHPYDYRQILVTAHLASGEKIDVTRIAPIAASANTKVSPNGLVRPAADGKGEVAFSLGGQAVKIPVTVSGQKEKYE